MCKKQNTGKGEIVTRSVELSRRQSECLEGLFNEYDSTVADAGCFSMWSERIMESDLLEREDIL